MSAAGTQLFDSTFRDGAQGEGISFSLDDKLKIFSALDKFGIDFIEAGNPFSNPRDLDFFKKIRPTYGTRTAISPR